ncbi:MAG: hypothetical protein C4532_11185 [Candidatus Abyssobacteria bacterium SURF_17]|uniref:Chorismate dehydratase n=1 Tax=Candidatus Abyssobacteria bacterium SURF_17 TaxID=2093361 RepID=A0A419EWV4_9BACT|nr:MAG: hypothetical protein C4532_11185 [Candidatus Abyssubacteria bacterium SURF_17]
MMSETRGALRVGSVPYLNARPLVRHLNPAQPPVMELRFEVPSRLTTLMEGGRLDVALLPSIEYFRSKGYRILPGISLSADGPVQSVCIFSKVPIERIRCLALDDSSRTSVALAKILLKRKLGSLPRLAVCSPDCRLRNIEADAALLIGDAAMRFYSQNAPFIMDLGEEWKKLTGLPFVYAMWVVRPGIDTRELEPKLLQARDEGVARIPGIAVEASRELGLSEEVCLNYLTNIMKYGLEERELEALRIFQGLAAQDGLCQGDAPLAVDH